MGKQRAQHETSSAHDLLINCFDLPNPHDRACVPTTAERKHVVKYFVGVDAGGTKCRMVLGDAQAKPLAQAVIDAPSNLQLRDGNAAYETITQLTQKLFQQADIDIKETQHAYACFGMAGGRLETARKAFAARQFPFAKVQVYDDIEIARAGAHEGAEGAVLIIGTGSAGLGIIDGVRHQVGGWGFHVGDSMAGATLGRELLRCALMAKEGLIEGSPLSEYVLKHFNDDLFEMMDWSFDGDAMRPADYGQFAPLVFEYEQLDDPLARKLVSFELEAIDLYVKWFMQRKAKSIAIVGGLGTYLLPRLQSLYGDIIVAPKASPLIGALIMARQMTGD